MMNPSGKWVPDVKGEPGKGYEVCVTREDFSHGLRSFGWYDRAHKRCLSTSGSPSGHSVDAFVWNRLVTAANEYADYLNWRESE